MMRRVELRFSSDDLAPLIWCVIALLMVFGVFSPNPLLTIASALMLALFIVLLTRPGEPPVLLLALGFQWLQVTMQVHQANFAGLEIEQVAMDYGGDIESALWLSMASLIVLALGMFVAIPRRNPAIQEQVFEESLHFSVVSMWRLYLAVLIATSLIFPMAWIAPGLTQPILAIVALKWAAYFVFAYLCLARNQHLGLLAIAFLLEFGMAVGGYFAEFKTVFFITLLALLAGGFRLSGRQALLGGVLAGLLLLASVVWSAIKNEYRDYLSGGAQAQIVVPDYFERTAKLAAMVSSLTTSDLGQGLETLAYRISYVQFFARTLDHVPDSLPHEDGEILFSAVRHVFMPRLFFPDKPPLREDSEETSYYTGLMIAGQGEGTSVSMGYVAQLYVDFGDRWMFVPIFFLGCLWGLIYRFFMTRKHLPWVFRYGLCVAVMLDVMRFETTLAKLLGGTITAFIAAYVIQRFMLPQLVEKVMRRGNGSERPQAFGSRV